MVFVNHGRHALLMLPNSGGRDAASTAAEHDRSKVDEVTDNIEFKNLKRHGAGDNPPWAMNGFCDVPICRHHGFCVQHRPHGLGGPMKGVILSVNLNMGENHSRALGPTTTFENALEVHGKFMTDHALCCCHPSIKRLRVGGIKREQVPNLRTIPVRDNHAPIHLQEVNDIAHDPSKDFSRLLGCTSR
jgi:hypothetical protein